MNQLPTPKQPHEVDPLRRQLQRTSLAVKKKLAVRASRRPAKTSHHLAKRATNRIGAREEELVIVSVKTAVVTKVDVREAKKKVLTAQKADEIEMTEIATETTEIAMIVIIAGAVTGLTRGSVRVTAIDITIGTVIAIMIADDTGITLHCFTLMIVSTKIAIATAVNVDNSFNFYDSKCD